MKLSELQSEAPKKLRLSELQAVEEIPQSNVASDVAGRVLQGYKNVIGGAVRGAGSIGATLLTPYDAAVGNTQSWGNPERREAMDKALEGLGVDTQAIPFKGGKLATEIAGTLGAGGMLAKGAQALGAAPAVTSALQSGGFTIGEGMGNALANGLLRTGAGAAVGATQAGLVDPENAPSGALFGGALPGVAYVAGKGGEYINRGAKALARSLMQSATKPTLKQLQTGEADAAVETMLKYGINPTKAGVEKLERLIDQADDALSNAISNSGATVDKQSVLKYLDPVKNKYSQQVAPNSDMGAIDAIGQEFAAHPGIPGNEIPVQLAQQLKQGTYKVLSGKYGEAGSAATEAQKALARGLKDEIASAVPEVSDINASLSALLNANKVAGRRALMGGNNNPIGLTPLAEGGVGKLAFLLDRSPAFKAYGARALNTLGEGAADAPLLLEKLSPEGRAAVIQLLSSQERRQ